MKFDHSPESASQTTSATAGQADSAAPTETCTSVPICTHVHISPPEPEIRWSNDADTVAEAFLARVRENLIAVAAQIAQDEQNMRIYGQPIPPESILRNEDASGIDQNQNPIRPTYLHVEARHAQNAASYLAIKFDSFRDRCERKIVLFPGAACHQSRTTVLSP